MPHDDNLAILVGQLGDGLFDMSGHFPLRRSLAGGNLGIDNLSSQLKAGCVVSDGRHGLLSVDATFRRNPMTPMSVDDSVFGDLSDPQVEGHYWVFQVIAEPAVGLEKHILDHIAYIDPLLNSVIQPHFYHAAQRGSVPVEQTIDGIRVALAGIFQQFFGRGRFWPHSASYYGLQGYAFASTSVVRCFSQEIVLKK